MYTLNDDRTVEYGWVRNNLLPGTGLVLDVGTPQGYPTPQMAVEKGWRVIAVDLMAQNVVGEHVEYRQGNIVTMEIKERFDYVLNISSVEHFGLAGRYTVERGDSDADLKAMAKIKTLMNVGAQMLLTVPVGVDEVVHPLHRVYGHERLPRLLEGYEVIRREFYAKRNDVDTYVVVGKNEALSTPPRYTDPLTESAQDHYYALGCFVLGAV